MAKDVIEIKVDNKELAQYLEAAFEDFGKTIATFTKEMGKDRKADLVVPNSFFQQMNSLKETFGALNKKKFEFNVNGFSELQKTLESLNKTFSNFKFPEEKEIKIPEQKAPIVNVDFKGFKEEFAMFLKQLQNTMLQAELTNLDQMPMVLSQSAAKNLAEANPLVHNLTLTDAGTVYEQGITGPTKGFIMQGTGDYDIQVRFSNAGPYWTIKSGTALEIGGYNEKVYAKSSTSGAVLEIIEIH